MHIQEVQQFIKLLQKCLGKRLEVLKEKVDRCIIIIKKTIFMEETVLLEHKFQLVLDLLMLKNI